MKKLMPVSAATIVAALTASLFGLVVLSLVPPSMAQQQQAEQQMTTDTTPTPSSNGTTTISLQELTNNQTITQTTEGGISITQQWSPRLFIEPQTAGISSATCGEGQVVIGGGYQASNPGVQILFEGPSLSVNAYAVQAYNGDTSSSFVQVYAICLSEAGLTPGQGQAAQEGSRQ
ncbi:MAG TPA: hypothetical protein VIP53_04070 [Nitrososphaera sp.]|jgi:hypothetical protein